MSEHIWLNGVEYAPVRTATRKAPTFYESVIAARVPCAYGVASCGRFAPKGVGSKQHSTCPKGRAAMKAASR